MEAIGTGASTLAFVLLALKSAKVIHESLSAIKDAPRIVRELVQDIQLLQSVLGRLTHCPLSNAPSSTITSFQDMLQACTAELSGIENRLEKFKKKPDSSRSTRVYKGILGYVKKEELEEARSRVRDKTTQANLYLGLLQAQAISDTTSTIGHQATATTGILEQILGEVARLHSRLNNDTASTAQQDDATEDVSASITQNLESMTLCSELEESISRLSSLVDHDGLTLDADDAEQIIDDLRKFILIARDRVSSKQTGKGKATANPYAVNDDSDQVRRDLKLIEGLMLSAPIVAINQPGTFLCFILTLNENQADVPVPNSTHLRAHLPTGAIIRQKRAREEIDVEHGFLTVSVNKRRRVSRRPNSSENASTHRDVVANIMFRPSQSPWMFSVSVSQGQLFDRSIQSIPRISVCPIIPNGSPVFRLVQEGKLREFRVLLDEGKASLRDHDEQGMPLLHYAAAGSVDMCKFLIESGADVDEMGENSGTALSHITGLSRHDTTLVLLENMADPTLSYPGWDNPLSAACSSDIPSVELFLKHGSHFALHDFESSDMNGRTRLHQICMADSRSTSKQRAVGMLVAAGADLNARILQSWSPDDHQTLGFTCLHSLVYTAHQTDDRDELETLVYLIRQGADPSAVDHHGNTVATRAYLPNENDNQYSSKGSYRGDLWDAAVAICGHDLNQFRSSYPRVPRYNKSYNRQDFERLWLGHEALCPYWNDKRYPETGRDEDYWKEPSQRCKHTSCSECAQYNKGLAEAEPDSVNNDAPMYDWYYYNKYPRSPSVEHMGYVYEEPVTLGRRYYSPEQFATSDMDPEEDYMDEMLGGMGSDEAELEAQYLLENSLQAYRDHQIDEDEDFLHALEPEDGPEPPFEEDSEDGEEAFQRLTHRAEDETDTFIDYWIDHDTPCQEEPEESHEDCEVVSPPASEDGGDVYERLTGRGQGMNEGF
ncbi:uncharacterized protein NECHADRAFT_83143 [Fusarium vanettenii 77-13-4]|uniref:Azaphilone pigments biosynthesis cluster protein L N-terminal domain-containing protein n=1 Tax=Fusarium vanettenii (strain ATCC MYA-4622 / CBS 123669 / FGSC 9596 / NRRL 45880 / 77-13-4) TaxID=660122 RepID=C7ZB28_FUSV7|nr:uncharacterized protein NECHADRAFT_83143 [Fusarium vanettenii 77-13-4]EEU38837.1 predicted protein [Fusarium vanettenii 77-13-4]